MRKIVLIATVFVFGNSAFAQWSNNPVFNNPLAVQAYDQQDVKIASDSKGGAITTWLDFRNDATQTLGDIYAQRIDVNGNVKWALDGIGVCTEGLHQTAPVICEDGVGGALIAWVDNRGGTKDIYAQRIDSVGNIVWSTTNGIAVAAKAGSQDNPRVLSDGSGGALFIWEDDSTGLDANLFVQHVSSTGTVLWGGGGYKVCNLGGAQINPKMVSDGAGGAVITWQDKRNGSDYDVYAQKINSLGVSQWTSGGVALCLIAGTQSNPKIVSDLLGGAVIAWQDKRSGIDYDVYAQYVNNSGVAMWTAGGKLVSNATGAQSAIDMCGDATGAIITWKDSRNVNLDIYAQKVDLLGNLLWTPNGLGICTSANDQINPNTVTDGAGGAIVVWQDSLLGNWDIRTQRVSAAGGLLWTLGGVDAGTAAANQTSPKNISDGSGGSIFTWQDKRSGNFDIYAFKIDASGTPVGISKTNEGAEGVLVYPNPSNGDVTFSVPANSTCTLCIYDATGKKIATESINVTYTLKEIHASGIYFYTLQTKDKMMNGKFIIER